MKRGIYFIFGLFVLSLLILYNVNAQATGSSITGEIVTGVATQDFGLNFTISGAVAPTLTLHSPKNRTYITNVSLLLNYSASSAQSVWFNLDNGANTTLTSYRHINLSEGWHRLYLFANSSNGTVIEKNINFTANTTLLVMSYEEFNGARKGRSTDFSLFDYEESQNLSDVILEDTAYGKISFNTTVNLTNVLNNLLDLDGYVNISHNWIELNSSYLLGLNKSATLMIYNLSFDNPRILMDGVVCPSTICEQNYYSNGNLSFNVTHFTAYSTEETPVEETVGSPGGGSSSGGGGGGTTSAGFKVDKSKIAVSIKQGNIIKESLTIRNTGKNKITINLAVEDLNEVLQLDESSFDIEGGKSRTVEFSVYAHEDLPLDTYIGRIIASGAGKKQEILVAVEVNSESSLFDVELALLHSEKEIYPGDEINFKVELYNLGETGRIDAELDFVILDSEKNELKRQKRTIAVDTRASLVYSLEVPENISPGEYLLHLEVNYPGGIARASEWFEIKKKPIGAVFVVSILLVLAIILLSAILIDSMFKKSKNLNKCEDNPAVKTDLPKTSRKNK